MAEQRSYSIRFEMKDGQVVKAELQDIAKVGDKSLKTLGDRAKEAAQKFSGLKTSSDVLKALGTSMKWIGGIATAAATGFALLFKNSVDWAGEIKDGAAQANLTAQSFQELRYVGTQLGIEFNTLTNSSNKFFAQAEEFVRTGGGAAANAFKDLGYSQSEVNKGLENGEKLLLDVVDRMRDLDAAAQINLAEKMFGKEGGKQFLLLIGTSSDEVSRLRQEAQNLGLVLSDDLIEKADNASDKLAGMAYILQTKVKVAVIENSDAVFELVDSINENLPTAIDKVKDFAQAIGLIDGRTSSEKLADLNKEIDGLLNRLENPTLWQRLTDLHQSGMSYLPGGKVAGNDIEDTKKRLAAAAAEQKALQNKIAGSMGGFKGLTVSTPEDKNSGGSTRPESNVNSGAGASGTSSADAIREKIDAMRQEIAITKESAREQAALRAVQSLGVEATAAQKEQARELAFQLYDQNEAVDKAKQAMQDYDSAVDNVANTIEDTLNSALKGNLRTWEDWGNAILDIVSDVITQAATLKYGEGGSLSTIFAQGLLDAFSASPSTTAPAGRATGGPVSAGTVYQWQERGREYFVPSSNGRVVPESKMAGGGGDVNVTVINNTSSQVSTQTKTAGGNREILLMIDQAVSANLLSKSSASRQALNSIVSPQVTRR